MVHQIHKHDDKVEYQVCQVIHVPKVQEVVCVSFTIQPLSVFTKCLVAHEYQHVPIEWIIENIEEHSLFDILLQGIHKEHHDTEHVS